MRVAWGVALVAGCGFQTAGHSGGKGGEPASDDFDVAKCPESYDAPIAGPSRYRLINDGRPAWVQSDACDADLPGATHLVVLETMAELLAVGAFIDNASGIAQNVWIGGVQLRGSVLATENWFGLDGAPLIGGWATNEPNDGTREDGGEQFVKIERSRHYFVDITGFENDGALCECDGKPVDTMIAEAISGYRPM